MATNSKFDDLPLMADFARRLFPAAGVIHIGAGTGAGPLHQWQERQLPFSLLIEADPSRFAWALNSLGDHPGRHAVTAVMSDVESEEDFFAASNPSESGLISPQLLHSVWPNLEINEARNCQVRRLDSLLDELGRDIAQQANWVIVDCFPALKILKGAGQYLECWNVLQLRVILDDSHLDIPGASLTELEAFLLPFGYHCVAKAESNHPAVGEALFIRDWPSWFNPKFDQLSRDKAKLTEQNAALMQAKGVLENQIESLEGEHKQAITTHDQLQQQFTEVQAQVQNQAQTQDELTGQVGQLTQAHDEQVKLAAGRHDQIQVLIQEKAELAEKNTALIHVKGVLENQIESLEGEQKQTVAARVQLQQQLAAVQAQVQNHAQVQDGLKAQVGQLSQEKAELAEKNTALMQAKGVLENQIESLEGEHKQAITTHDQLQQQFTEVQAQVQNQAQTQDELTGQVGQLTQAHDEQVKLAAGRHDQIQVLIQEKAELAEKNTALIHVKGVLENQIESLEGEQKQTVAARVQLQQQLAAVQAQVQNHAQVQDGLKAQVQNQAQAQSENKAQVIQLSQEKVELAEQNTTLMRARSDLEMRVESLQAELAESSQRQQLLNDEMVKAEAQIDLIKDVLLREPGL